MWREISYRVRFLPSSGLSASVSAIDALRTKAGRLAGWLEHTRTSLDVLFACRPCGSHELDAPFHSFPSPTPPSAYKLIVVRRSREDVTDRVMVVFIDLDVIVILPCYAMLLVDGKVLLVDSNIV